MDKSNDENGSARLRAAIINYSNNLEALREFADLTGHFLLKTQMESVETHKEDLLPLALAISRMKPHGLSLPDFDEEELKKAFGADIEVDATETGVTISIKNNYDAGKRFENAVKEIQKRSKHSSLVYQSSLISLISTAEWFISQILREYFRLHPDAAEVKDKSLTLKQLSDIGSIDEARGYLLNQRVDEIMWGSLDDWLSFLRKPIGLSMTYLDKPMAELTEIFQHRNVIIHNDGIVNPTYIAKVDVALRSKTKLGQKLTVSSEYLQNAIDIIELNFILVAAELWKKLFPKDEGRSSALTEIAINHLSKERWRVGEGLSYFTMHDKQLPENAQLVGKLNYWQSLKWQDRFAEVYEEVKNADFSAKGDIYRLAKLVLLDQYPEAFSEIFVLLAASKLGKDDLLTWPIFRELRKQPQYNSLLEEARSEPKKSRIKKKLPLIN